MDVSNLSDHDRKMVEKSGVVIPGVTDTPVPAATGGVSTDGNEPGDKPGQPEGAQTPPAASTEGEKQRPEWCPEEFWNAETGAVDSEGLAKKYAELNKPAEPPKTPEGDPPATPPEAPKTADAKFAELVELANADILNPELGGKLKDETYAAFEKDLGMSRETIDEFIEGQHAKAELTKLKVYEVTGSEASFKAMFDWAIADENNYSTAEREMFDKMMNSGKPEQAVAAAKTLKARYEAAEGKSGDLAVPAGQPSASLPGYNSKEEVTAAMRDPRYKRDPAFRKEVEAKLQAAIDAGRNLFGNG